MKLNTLTQVNATGYLGIKNTSGQTLVRIVSYTCERNGLWIKVKNKNM